MECAHDAALEDRPEAFNAVGVDCANDVLPLGMIDDAVRKFLAQMFVADPLIGTEQTDLVRHGLTHERFKRAGAHVFNDASNDVAFAADGANDGRFPGANPARSFATTALVLVSVLG